MLNAITWNVDPEIFGIGFLHIRWYGLLWALAIFSAFWVVISIYKHEGRPELWSDKLFIYGAVSLVIGARLGHCLFYEPTYYLTHPLKLLEIWEGGLASHGGAVGLLIGMWLYNRYVVKKSYLYVMDRLVIGVAIGGALIRLGNLMNSEIFGGPTNLAWGFNFVNSQEWRQIGVPVHPTQIYEIIYCLITFAICMLMYWKWRSYRREGLILGVFLIGIFLSRFLLEFIKLNQEKFEENMILNMGQLLSLPLIIWAIYLIINALRKPSELQDFEKAGYKRADNEPKKKK
jgi:prolipoprotein diacylglyceryl transferase